MFVFFTLAFLALPRALFAQSEFVTDVLVTYEAQTTGKTRVTHFVTLTNTLSNIYATSYTLKLQGIEATNITASSGGKNLTATSSKQGDSLAIKIDFEDAVVGKGQKRNFTIAFDDASLAQKAGEVWEVSIPRLSNTESFNSYVVTLTVPSAFGEKAYISPTPDKEATRGTLREFTFNKETISEKGVTAAFGPFQVFSFDLTYHLENPLMRTGQIEIAIPPDTSFQKVSYESIEPQPVKVTTDKDGNWLALFRLKSRERLDVKAVGSVQIFSKPLPNPIFNASLLTDNIKETEFWQVNDPFIKNLANQLKTPRAIYNYLVTNFSYDYERVRPNVARLGAKEALLSPKNAICTEFTDAFVALARALGIPAREVNGYAYTENPKIQPLSLVADVLHAWPEYWDEIQKIWVPVDPTWGNTTGGLDYFTKLDLRHFTFVNHGQDAAQPYPPGSYKLGSNPQKDVFVSFGQLPPKREEIPQIEIKHGPRLPFAPLTLSVLVKNTGPTALYNQNLSVFSDKATYLSQQIASLPPWGEKEIAFKIPYKLIGTQIPENLTVNLGGNQITSPTPKISVIITNLSFVFVGLFLIVFLIYIYGKTHTRKRNPQRIT